MPVNPELHALESDVEQSRARLADTLDKLTSPETAAAVKKEAMDYAQGIKNDVMGYMNKTKDDLLGKARDTASGKASDLKARALANPLGIALIGAGIAWRLYKHPPITTVLIGAGVAALMAGGSGSKRADPSAYRDPYDEDRPRGYVPGGVAGYGYPADMEVQASRAMHKVEAAASAAGDTARGMAERAREVAYETGERLSDAAHVAGERVSAAVESARSSISERLGDGAAARGRRAEGVSRTAFGMMDTDEDASDHGIGRGSSPLQDVHKNPYVLGALGVAAGVYLGRSLRSTNDEDRFAGWPTHVRDRGSRETTSDVGHAGRRVTETASELASSAGETLGSAVHRGAELAGNVASSVAELASGIGSAATRAFGSAAETVTASASATSRAASSSYRTMAGGADRARYQAPRASRWFEDEVLGMGRRYPLLLGAIALTVGAAAGGMLRSTETEQQLLGPLSDRIKRRVREVADEQFGQVRETAEEFANQVQTRFATPSQPDDSASDFEEVLGGGKPPVEQAQATAVEVERSAGVSPGASGFGRGR